MTEFFYFDHNATTPLSEDVQQAILSAMSLFANPSGNYCFSAQVKHLLEEARGAIASLIHSSPEQILFTSGGTESNNFALNSLIPQLPDQELSQHHIICSSIEHSSILEPLFHYEKQGLKVTWVDPDRAGRVSVSSIERAIQDNTCLIVLMAVNNETGVIQPYQETAVLAEQYRIALHVDAVQAVGKIPIDCSKLTGLSTLSFSAHKFNGPKGIGGLYYAKGLTLTPLLLGGGQEKGMRSGTENTLGLAGLSAAAKEASNKLNDSFHFYRELHNLFLLCLEKSAVNYVINGEAAEEYQAPWTINISFPGVRAESLASRLDFCHGMAISLGSACSSNKAVRRSHVLSAMKLPNERIDGAIRISFGRGTTFRHIEKLAFAINKEINYLLGIAGEVKESSLL